MSQIKSLMFDVCIYYAHQLQLGSLMIYNHYASMYIYYSVMIIGLYLIVFYFGPNNVCHTRVRLSHNFQNGSDGANFKIGTG